MDKVDNDPILNQCEDFQLLGDFNIDLLKARNHSLTGVYADTLFAHGHLPLITQPTRILGKSSTLIDHITTTFKFDNYKAGIILTYISDHLPVFHIRQTPVKKYKPGIIFTRKINLNTISCYKSLLESVPWNAVLEENRPEHAFNKFFERIDDCGDMAFPEVQVRINRKTSPLNPWMTPGLLLSRKRKEKLAIKKLKSPSQTNIDNFRIYNSLYNKTKRAAIKLYYESKFKEFSQDIRATWDTVREALGTSKNKSKISNVFRIGNRLVKDNKAIAKGFNEFFSKVGEELASHIRDSTVHFSEFLGERIIVNFIFAPLTAQTLTKIASQMKPKSSRGPD